MLSPLRFQHTAVNLICSSVQQYVLPSAGSLFCTTLLSLFCFFYCAEIKELSAFILLMLHIRTRTAGTAASSEQIDKCSTMLIRVGKIGQSSFLLFISFSVVLLHLSITSVDVNFTGVVISVNRSCSVLPELPSQAKSSPPRPPQISFY